MLMSSHPFVQRYRDYLMLHFVILIWGFTGILGKVITVPYFSIVIYRMGIAFVGLFLFFLWKKRKFETNKNTQTLRFEKSQDYNNTAIMLIPQNSILRNEYEFLSL